MKVLGVSNVYNAYMPQKANDVKRTGKTGEKRDALSISDAAKDYQAVAKAVAKAPDVRQEKVDAIKAKMQSDGYLVSSTEIADKILAF